MEAVIEVDKEVDKTADVATDTAARLADNTAAMLERAIVEWRESLSVAQLKIDSIAGRNHSRVLAEAAANTLTDTPDNIEAARRAVHFYGQLLFALPAEELDLMGTIRRAGSVADFDKTVLGRIWWLAVNWVFADDLISLRDAADMTRTKMPNISQSDLTFVINPEANRRQERRLALRSEVAERWAKRIASFDAE